MAGLSLTTRGIVLLRRPPTDAFQAFTLFSDEHGALRVMHRVPKKPTAAHLALDLFDELSLLLENASGGTGDTWFVKEALLVVRHADLGRRYEALVLASALATLVARNPVPEESRAAVYTLLQQAFEAFTASDRPDIVYFKSLYRFARDEGYPIKQEWLPTLPAADREATATLLNRPLATQTLEPARVTHLQSRFESYLRGHTEVLLD